MSRLVAEHGGRGFALVVVLWIVLIAGVMLLGVLKAARVNYALGRTDLAVVQARWAARAGVELGMAMLEDDPQDVDDMSEPWYDDPALEKVELTTGTFTLVAPAEGNMDARRGRRGLIDHAARLDLNTADEKALAALEQLADMQIDALLDWRDGDDEARPGGAELGYYQRLDFPYEIRNDRFRSLAELRLVRWMDDQAFFGEDANLNGLLDANECDLHASWPPDDGDLELSAGLAGAGTVYAYERNRRGDGKKRLNVKSAEKDTLVQELGITAELAQAIVDKRPDTLMDLVGLRGQQRSGGQGSGRGGGGGSDASGQGESSGSSSDQGQEKTNEITLGWLAQRLDELTVSEEERLPARINVNTASRRVLLTLPEMKTETADAIVARQRSSKGPFRSVGELLGEKVLTEEQFKAMAERVTVRSSVFEIRSTAVAAGGVRHTIVAVVDRGANPMKILYWYQSE